MSDQTVALTFLAQLGGPRFIAMTGAYSLTSAPGSLSARLPITGNKLRAGGFRVTLNDHDLYDLVFVGVQMKNGITRFADLATATDIYEDQLQETFSALTGLATHL